MSEDKVISAVDLVRYQVACALSRKMLNSIYSLLNSKSGFGRVVVEIRNRDMVFVNVETL